MREKERRNEEGKKTGSVGRVSIDAEQSCEFTIAVCSAQLPPRLYRSGPDTH